MAIGSWLAVGLALALASAGVAAGDDPPPRLPYSLPRPPGWKSETIPFPLDFAPEIGLRGLEELRFAPGMFKVGAEDYWSYVFLWWIDGEVPLDATKIGGELSAYFEGLAQAVAEEKGIEMPNMAFSSHLQARHDPHTGEERLIGHARAFDAFTALEPVDLNIRARLHPCRAPGKTVAVFEVSPQPFSHPIWKELETIRTGLDCSP